MLYYLLYLYFIFFWLVGKIYFPALSKHFYEVKLKVFCIYQNRVVTTLLFTSYYSSNSTLENNYYNMFIFRTIKNILTNSKSSAFLLLDNK